MGVTGEAQPANGAAGTPAPVPVDVGNNPLTYTTSSGKQVKLNGDNRNKCIQSCEAAPELKDTSSSGMGSLLSAASGGEDMEIRKCANFCNAEFEYCFPVDSTVVVRDRGRVPLSELAIGDEVLSVAHRHGQAFCARWELCFDTVLAFLHADAESLAEVICVHHSLGQALLTPNHLLFVQKRACDAVAPIRASEVCPGDRLLAPWIDGSLMRPEVKTVDRVWKKGLVAPLVNGGILLVNGTAASCYAVPANIASTPLLQHLVKATDAWQFHTAAHAFFLPLRLVCHAAAMSIKRFPRALAISSVSLDKETPHIHPYAWLLYVLAASCVA